MALFQDIVRSSSALKLNVTNVLTMKVPRRDNSAPNGMEIGRPLIAKVMRTHNLTHKALILLTTGPTRGQEHTIISGIKFHLTMKNMIDHNDPRIRLVADPFDHEWYLQADNDALFEVIGTTSKDSGDIRRLSRMSRHEHPVLDEGNANCVGYVDYLAVRILDPPPSRVRTLFRRLWGRIRHLSSKK